MLAGVRAPLRLPRRRCLRRSRRRSHLRRRLRRCRHQAPGAGRGVRRLAPRASAHAPTAAASPARRHLRPPDPLVLALTGPAPVLRSSHPAAEPSPPPARRTRRGRRGRRTERRCQRVVRLAAAARVLCFDSAAAPAAMHPLRIRRTPVNFSRPHRVLHRRRRRRAGAIDHEPEPHTPSLVARDPALPPVVGLRSARSLRRGEDVDRDARLAAPLPPLLRLDVLRQWDARVPRALSMAPLLLPRTPSSTRYRIYLQIPDHSFDRVRGLTASCSSHLAVESASIFLVPKPGKSESRIIVDCRRTNARDPGWPRLSARPPTLADIAAFLQGTKFAATADFRSWFYAFPLGPCLRRLFFIPAWQRAVARLPMGWLRASDIATAATAAIADLPWEGRHRVSRRPTPRQASAFVCADNILIAGPNPTTVSARVSSVNHRARAVRATFSETFQSPSSSITYFGVRWNLQDQSRSLPVRRAMQIRQSLLRFTRSRGPVPVDTWRRVVGQCGWVASVCSLDIRHRASLVRGLRAVSFCRAAVPSRASRMEARRHALAALRRVPLAAPSTHCASQHDFATLPADAHVFETDAAVPGAVAVLYYRPGRQHPQLIHWSRCDPGEAIVCAELRGVAQAARYAMQRRLSPVVICTDARSVYDMVARGLSRNARHQADISLIRQCSPRVFLVWLSTRDNHADSPSRSSSFSVAERSARSAGGSPLAGRIFSHTPLATQLPAFLSRRPSALECSSSSDDGFP